MLDTDIPANFISFLYPNTTQIVRAHRHSEDNSVWLVAKDVCSILRITNPSYVAKKIDKTCVYRHKTVTDGGKQVLTWFRIDEVIKLSRSIGTPLAYDFAQWLLSCKENIPLPDKSATKHVFKEPVIIEKSTLLKIKKLLEELELQIVK